MNFMSIEYFMAVADKRNITRAAEELHITQQTLSAHISALEKEFACQFFIRSNPLELTYAGELFLQHVREIYEEYQSMWNEFNDMTLNQRGKLLVGINYTRSHSIMPKVVAAFQEEYPNIEVRLIEGVNDALQKNLVNKDIDLAIARFPETIPGIILRDFYEENVIMCVPRKFLQSALGQELASMDLICADDLRRFSQYPFLMGSQDDSCCQISKELLHASGIDPKIKVRSNNLGTLLLMCARGVGVCFCAESLVRTGLTGQQFQQIKIYHLKGVEASYPVRFGYRKTSYQWKIILEFIRIALETVGSIGGSVCDLCVEGEGKFRF